MPKSAGVAVDVPADAHPVRSLGNGIDAERDIRLEEIVVSPSQAKPFAERGQCTECGLAGVSDTTIRATTVLRQLQSGDLGVWRVPRAQRRFV